MKIKMVFRKYRGANEPYGVLSKAEHTLKRTCDRCTILNTCVDLTSLVLYRACATPTPPFSRDDSAITRDSPAHLYPVRALHSTIKRGINTLADKGLLNASFRTVCFSCTPRTGGNNKMEHAKGRNPNSRKSTSPGVVHAPGCSSR